MDSQFLILWQRGDDVGWRWFDDPESASVFYESVKVGAYAQFVEVRQVQRNYHGANHNSGAET